MRAFIFLFLLSAINLCLANTPEKAIVCSACHGTNGISNNPLWPNLAGQHSAYLLQQLKHYQEGQKRCSPMMTPMMATLTEADIQALADYYAAQTIAPPVTLNQKETLGERLYRIGDPQKSIPACIACHGPDGRGAAEAGFPMISHQQPDYIMQQLQLFKTGQRSSDPMKMMQTISARLNEKEMRALAKYLASLN